MLLSAVRSASDGHTSHIGCSGRLLCATIGRPGHWVDVYYPGGVARCSGGSKKSVIRSRLSTGRDGQKVVPQSLPAILRSVYICCDVSCWSLSRHLHNCTLPSRTFQATTSSRSGLGEVLQYLSDSRNCLSELTHSFLIQGMSVRSDLSKKGFFLNSLDTQLVSEVIKIEHPRK